MSSNFLGSITSFQIVFVLVSVILSPIAHHYITWFINRRKLPPGPIPLPFLGNYLLLKRVHQQQHYVNVLTNLSIEYGPMFTFYMGSEPQIFVFDKDLSLEVMKRDVFAGRPVHISLKDYWFHPDALDITFGDYTKEWEIVRRASHGALRRYASSDNLHEIAVETVDEAVSHFKKMTDEGRPIDVIQWMFRILYAILAKSTFGQKFALTYPDLNDYIRAVDFQQKTGIDLILFDFLPIMKYIYFNQYKKFKQSIKVQNRFRDRQFDHHMNTFDGVNVRDFTDALMMAKKEVQVESPELASRVLTNHTMMGVLRDLFAAGSNTSKDTLSWLFLLVALYPDYQRKMRIEIEDVVGETDTPTVYHRAKCHFVAAFIAETLRFRHVVPLNLPHKAMEETILGQYNIPKGTTVVPLIFPLLMNKEVWGGDSEVFRPDRFLDGNGVFVPKPNKYYNPFSGGRRSCPGDKVALANIFVVLARMLQQTKGWQFVLPDKYRNNINNLNGNPTHAGAYLEVFIWVPHYYELFLEKDD